MTKRWWNWVCEYCYKQLRNKTLPESWQLVWQCAICPRCWERAQQDGGVSVVKCGQYAGKRKDPRSTHKAEHN